MVRVTTGHEHGHLRPAYVTLTDAAIYILRKGMYITWNPLLLQNSIEWVVILFSYDEDFGRV